MVIYVGGVRVKGIKIIPTYNCNITCGCCEYKCAPYKKGIMKVREFDTRVHNLYKEGYTDQITIEGGEPFQDPAQLYKYLKSISDLDSKKIIETNGSWGNKETFLDIIYELKKIGLYGIKFEYDFYHSVFINMDTVMKAIEKAIRCGLVVMVKARFNSANASSKEDRKTFDCLKEIRSRFDNIIPVFSEIDRSYRFRQGICNIDEKVIMYRDLKNRDA